MRRTDFVSASVRYVGAAIACLASALAFGCSNPVVPPLSELGGSPWTLTSFDTGVAAAAEPAVTLVFEGDRISGSSGCNRYFAPITPGEAPGEVSIGAVGATRRMCPPTEMEVEGRYLGALQKVVSYSLSEEKLRLVSRDGGVDRTLSFSR